MLDTKIEHEVGRLRALTCYAILGTPPEAPFDEICGLAAHLCETPIALVSFVEADRTVCFIHPADPAMLAELRPEHRGERYAAIEKTVAALPGIELVPVAAFDLTGEDFSDINHVEPRTGRAKMTRQLARAIFRD